MFLSIKWRDYTCAVFVVLIFPVSSVSLPTNSSVVTCQGSCLTLWFRYCLRFAVLVAQSLWCSYPECPLCLRILNVLFPWSLYSLHHNFGLSNGVSSASRRILLPLGGFSLSLVFLRLHHCVAIYITQLVYLVPLIIKYLRVELFWAFLISYVLLFLPSLLWFGRGSDNNIDVIKN